MAKQKYSGVYSIRKTKKLIRLHNAAEIKLYGKMGAVPYSRLFGYGLWFLVTYYDYIKKNVPGFQPPAFEPEDDDENDDTLTPPL